MWEEDPRWREANYLLLVGGTAGFTVLATGCRHYGLSHPRRGSADHCSPGDRLYS